MHELPWITILGSRVRRFANHFHEWRSHEWKSLANRITSDPKIVIFVTRENYWQIASLVTPKSLFTVTNVLFYFLHAIWCPWTHNSPKQLSNANFAIATKDSLSDLLLWRHHSLSVTSSECRTLALWRHMCRLFLHAQIGAKAIFTSE